MESKKADLMHGREEEMKQPNASQANEEQAISEATTGFDGMTLVNKIKLGPAVQNCRQLEPSWGLCCLKQTMRSKSVLCLIDIWRPHWKKARKRNVVED